MKLLMIRFMYVHWTLDSINMKMKVVYVEGEIPEEHHPIIVLHGGLLSLNTSLIWEI